MNLLEANHTAQDKKRLAVLRQLALLDSPIEESFDRLTRLASQITESPISLVSLVDADRQFFKSQVGLTEELARLRQTPLSHSFCKHVVADNAPLIVEDARKHPILKDNLAVPDLGVIGYLGMPLTTTNGVGLGSFCVIDTAPREWSLGEIEIMRELALMVMTEIELKAQIIARKKAEAALQQYANTLEQRVTDRTQELTHVYEQLQELDQLKSKFIDDISHELRTPVTNINIYLDLLANGTPDKRAKVEAVLREQSGRLTSLLNSILDFSNQQKRLKQSSFESIDLADVVSDVVLDFEAAALEKNLALYFERGEGRHLVWGNASQLDQVVRQLLQNALAYTPDGHIGLSLHVYDHEEAKVTRLTIEDSGMGMDEEELANCFERFYRGKRIGQLNIASGSGLGLSRVKDIVTYHKGQIVVESVVDQGSRFSVFLPLKN